MLDLAFISLLVYTSGGPFSQLRFAFFLIPLMAAAILTPRMTLLVSGLAVSSFATIALVYPTTGVAGARTFELAQLAYLAVAALAAFLLAIVLERRRAAIEELAESRRQLVAQALDAEDRERRRLAEALHDEAMQTLLATRQELAAAPADLARARDGIDRAVADLRSAIFDLHPHLLGEAGLGAALEAVADGHRRRGGAPAVVVDAAVEGTAPRRAPVLDRTGADRERRPPRVGPPRRRHRDARERRPRAAGRRRRPRDRAGPRARCAR